MRNSIYHRLHTFTLPQLRYYRRMWTIATDQRPTPQRHDYLGKCLTRVCLLIEQKEKEKDHARTHPRNP